MKKALICLLVVLVLIVGALFAVPREATVTDFAMDTVVSVTVRSRDGKHKASLAMEEIKRIEKLMSISLPQSDIYKVNSSGAGVETQVSDEVYALVELCLDVSQKTEGAFDITVEPLSELWNIKAEDPRVPEDSKIEKAKELADYKSVILNPDKKTILFEKEGMKISLGAVAKGYAADMAARCLVQNGVEDALVDIGGNIYALGDKKIGIQTPFQKRGEYYTVCEVKDTSVVTSGAYERYFEKDGKLYHHIIDPRTGYPAESSLASVTVISDSSALSDALSTAVFVMGEEGAKELLLHFDKAQFIMLREDGTKVEIK